MLIKGEAYSAFFYAAIFFCFFPPPNAAIRIWVVMYLPFIIYILMFYINIIGFQFGAHAANFFCFFPLPDTVIRICVVMYLPFIFSFLNFNNTICQLFFFLSIILNR